MSTYSIYFSPTQGTRKITNLLTEEFSSEYLEIDLCDPKVDFGAIHFSENDICLIGVPSYGGRVPELAVSRLRQFHGNQAKAILVVCYGNRDYDDTLLELYDTAKEQDFLCVSGVAAIAEHSLMRQFAAGRPDADDVAQLKSFVPKIKEKLSLPVDGMLQLKGNRPYKEYNGVPFKPIISDSCNHCGVCAKSCPAEAISLQKPHTTDTEKCISCMRCIQVCPSKARHLDEEMLLGVSQKMAPLFAERKENELFL